MTPSEIARDEEFAAIADGLKDAIISEQAATIRALIAENERLRDVNAKRAAIIADLVMERDEAVALLREASIMHKDMHEVISALLARIDRDEEYNAIMAGLKDAVDMSENA